ncbi:MAG: DMT family transporter [Gammaproteobacteria bacterium]|jgi:drug/metabolite transporter (DMT)-like permease|nr:DMT family transporter [Gammaproteobacteria bacterium]
MHALLPVLSLLYAATVWGTVWYPLRLLADAGIAGPWQAAVSYLAAALALLPFYWPRRRELARRAASLMPLAVTAGWANVAFIVAMLEGTVVRVLLLFYLSPVWSVLLAHWLLGERLTRRTWAALGGALGGAALMLYKPGAGLPLPTDLADWLGLSAGLAFAVSNVETRRLQDVGLQAKTLAAWAGVVVVAGAWVGAVALPLPSAGALPWLGTVALGLTAFFSATLAVQYGLTRLPVQRSAVILLVEIVVGAVTAAWLAGEYTAPREWIGGLLILGAGLAVARAEEGK